MGWRKIVRDDIQRGLIIRDNRIINDGGFGMMIVIGAPDVTHSSVRCSRPMAWAHDHFNSRSALLSEEVVDYPVETLMKGDYEVFQGRDGVRTQST